MDTFGFTKHKFLKISENNQHRHLIKWLSGFYHTLTTNRVSPQSLDLFSSQYNQVLNWMGLGQFNSPDKYDLRKWMEAISDHIHKHRLAAGLYVRDHDLLEQVSKKDFEQVVKKPNFECHIALDGLRSLFNVGSIFRTCEAAGFRSVILGNTAGKEDKRVCKTAMGAEQWIEQEKTDDLAQTLLDKKEQGFQIIGVETVLNSSPYNEFNWQNNSILVFGNEEYGISSHVLRVCDTFIHIPMFGKKNSINVANAVASVCFQAACILGDSASI